MTRDECREMGRELVRRSRAAQGLPPTVTDPATIARLAEILAGADRLEVGDR